MNPQSYDCNAITVYCSSSNHVSRIYLNAARELGSLIADKGYKLVFGGCQVGLMGAVSAGAREKGGKVVGIILERFVNDGIADPTVKDMYTLKDMRSRKKALEENGDAYIVLPGGFGTLEEITEILSFKEIGFHKKPIVFVNVNGYFDHLIKQFELGYQEKFIEERFQQIYDVARSPQQALDIIRNYRPPEIESKYRRSFEID